MTVRKDDNINVNSHLGLPVKIEELARIKNVVAQISSGLRDILVILQKIKK